MEEDKRNTVLPKSVFKRILDKYSSDFPVQLCVIDTNGRVIHTCDKLPGKDDSNWQDVRRYALNEAIRWGEPTLYSRPAGYIVWAMPIMHNAAVTGGLIACIKEDDALGDDGTIKLDLKDACEELLNICVDENITNSFLLESHRLLHLREQKRAEAIHSIKSDTSRDIIERYLHKEPALVSAIKRGHRQKAIEILNTTLSEIYYLGGSRLDVIKSLIMELAVTMCRAAISISSRGGTLELLGNNYSSLAELAGINTEEELAHWIVNMLNRIMDSIEKSNSAPSQNNIEQAIEFIETHYDQHITRETAASHAGMSESHFAKILKEKTGLSFTDMLNRVRLDKAAQMLRKTDKSIMQISLETGFSDQSYFTRVFRKNFKLTPLQYRSKYEK